MDSHFHGNDTICETSSLPQGDSFEQCRRAKNKGLILPGLLRFHGKAVVGCFLSGR